MATIVSFPKPNGGRVWINPAHVTKIEENSMGHAAIYLVSGEKSVPVDGSAENVAIALNANKD